MLVSLRRSCLVLLIYYLKTREEFLKYRLIRGKNSKAEEENRDSKVKERSPHVKSPPLKHHHKDDKMVVFVKSYISFSHSLSFCYQWHEK